MASVPMKLLPLSTCTALVPLGEVTTTLNMNFNSHVRGLILFPRVIVEQLVGHLLGDGHLSLSHTSITPNFVFVQALAKFSYLWHVYWTLRHYCKSLPKASPSYRAGTLCIALYVYTRSYPLMNYLYSLFYVVGAGGNKIKVITWDLMPYLTPLAIAYWLMDDGTYRNGILILATDGFTFEDVYRLAAMLHSLYGFKVKVQKFNNNPRIVFSAADTKVLRSMVLPHRHSSMLYKLGL